jgi:hypothetical protein
MIRNYEEWLNESQESFQLDVEEGFDSFCENYAGEDEPGWTWEVGDSTAKDERHYPSTYESDWDSEEEEDDFEEEDYSGTKVEACSAVEALLLYMKGEYNSYGRKSDSFNEWGEVWSGTNIGEWEEGKWKNNIPQDCEDSNFCDWHFDDGCYDGDEYHWKIITVKKLTGPKLTPEELKEWKTLDYRMKKRFVQENQPWAAFKAKYRGAISGIKYKI